MIDSIEASHRARELVMQYVGEAGPECAQDYLKLLIMLATVTTNTMAAYVGSDHEGIRQMGGALDELADEMRRLGPETRAEANAKRLH